MKNISERIHEAMKVGVAKRQLGKILLATAADIPIIQNNRWSSTAYPGEIRIHRRGGWFYGARNADFYYNQISPSTHPLFTSIGTNALEEILNDIGKTLRYGDSSVNITIHRKIEFDFVGYKNIPPIPVFCANADFGKNSPWTESLNQQAIKLVFKISKILFPS